MPDCYAKGCKSRRTESRKNKIQLEWERSHGKKISFHRIPRKLEERKKWIHRMELDENSIPEIAFVCSLHFEETDLDRTSLAYTRIRSNAVPFRNVNISKYKKNKKPLKQQKMLEEHSVEAVKYNNHSIENCTNTPEADGIKSTISTIIISTRSEAIDAVSQQNSTPHSSKIIDQGTLVSPCLTENTPRKQMLRAMLMKTRKEFQKKIKILKQKQRRTAKCFAKLKEVLTSLKKKNLLDAHQLDILKDLGISKLSTSASKAKQKERDMTERTIRHDVKEELMKEPEITPEDLELFSEVSDDEDVEATPSAEIGSERNREAQESMRNRGKTVW